MSRHEAFDAVLAALHEATFDDSRWPAVAGLIDETCRIKGNMFVCGSDVPGGDVVIHLARLCYRGERHEEFERLYFREYYPQDERVPRFRALPDSRLVHVSNLYSEEEKRTSAVYNEALPQSDTQNSLSVRMDGPNGSRIVWTLGDPVEGDGWSSERMETLGRLLPHLRHYVRIRQVLADMDGLKGSVAALLDRGATGVVQLNRQGRIVAANDRARNILNRRECLSDRGGLLRVDAPADNARLQGLLARALAPPGAGGSMAVTGPPGPSRLVLHVTPVGRREDDLPPWEVAALVLVVHPYGRLALDRALVEAALDLSPAESRVAVLLAQGRTVREVAAATGRSENTIRWHVRQIFAKHGLTRLGQLASLVRSLAGHSGAGS
ncbi:MAG: helix-turn-helix transcriptional regulator [Rhodospirillaceae bacterium]|nr:helix-turn-helix transcriptional regulator [Rhodospirillaceae bacterium]